MAENDIKIEESCGACLLKDKCTQKTDSECHYTRAQQWKAVALGYILPFIVLVAGIVVMECLQWNEMLIGAVALGLVGLYYLILWACKPTIKQKED